MRMISFLFIFSLFLRKKKNNNKKKRRGKKIDVCYKALKEFHRLSPPPPLPLASPCLPLRPGWAFPVAMSPNVSCRLLG